MKKALKQKQYEKLDITQEEREEIFEEQEARSEARLQIEADVRQERRRWVWRVIFNWMLFFAVVGFVFWSISYFRYYNSITVESLDAKVTAQEHADYQQARANLQAAGVNPDNPNGPRLGVVPPKLDELSQNFYVENGFCNVVGEVKNISSEKLANVEATATFYDKNNDVVKTDDVLIEYNPILPGQTSPFHIVTTSNPAIETVRINFAYLGGAEIPARHN